MDASTPSSPQFASGPGRGQITPAATPSKRCLPYDLTSPMNRDGAAGCCAEPRARSPPYAPPGPRNPQPKPSLRYLEPRTLEPRGRPAHTLHHRHAPTRHPAVHPAARAAADRVQLQTARAPSPPTAARLRSPSPTHSREVRESRASRRSSLSTEADATSPIRERRESTHSATSRTTRTRHSFSPRAWSTAAPDDTASASAAAAALSPSRHSPPRSVSPPSPRSVAPSPAAARPSTSHTPTRLRAPPPQESRGRSARRALTAQRSLQHAPMQYAESNTPEQHRRQLQRDLFRHPVLIDEAWRWWCVLGCDASGVMRRDEYLQLFLEVCGYARVARRHAAEALQRMAQASYAALGCPSDGLGWWHFYTALYKFTQLWCSQRDGDAYVLWLAHCMRAVVPVLLLRRRSRTQQWQPPPGDGDRASPQRASRVGPTESLEPRSARDERRAHAASVKQTEPTTSKGQQRWSSRTRADFRPVSQRTTLTLATSVSTTAPPPLVLQGQDSHRVRAGLLGVQQLLEKVGVTRLRQPSSRIHR